MTNKKIQVSDSQDNIEDKTEKQIKVKREEKSSLADFIRRPIANDEELNNFEDSIKASGRDEEINENLNDIYKDKKGKMVDVSKLNIKAKKSLWFKLFRFFFVIIIISAALYLAYMYLYQDTINSKKVDLRINGPQSVLAGEEFKYIVEIFNASDTDIYNVELDMNYANNFIYIDSSLPNNNTNNSWDLGSLKAKERTQIEISGIIIAKSSTPNLSQAILTYTPGNFSSQFQETADINTLLQSHGFNIDFDYLNTALEGEAHEVSMLFSQEDKNLINSFDLRIEAPDNIEILAPKEDGENDESDLEIVSKERNTLVITGLDKKYDTQELKFRYRVNEKINDNEQIKLVFFQNVLNQEYVFLEKNIDLKIMKSDLNLSLIVNGSKNGQAVNFGENLNYTLSYQNKGEVSLEDVTIMLVIDSTLVDWENIEDNNKGVKGSNTIAWSKVQIPDLAEIKPEEQGNINIILPVKRFDSSYIGQDLSIDSYAQFSMKTDEELSESPDNRSNEIINDLNSDLNIDETILYFDEENIPVGSGPLPPKVGESTKFRVYWEINNNLHDLNDVIVELSLPDHISYQGIKKVDLGIIDHRPQDNKLIWDIDYLATSNSNIRAEFDISINPKEEDIDKILVLSPGAEIRATDTDTSAILKMKAGASTTKLEDDEIANLSSDGRIVP
jgi:uncharacterized repeat protein (TIGR01451 family)